MRADSRGESPGRATSAGLNQPFTDGNEQRQSQSLETARR